MTPTDPPLPADIAELIETALQDARKWLHAGKQVPPTWFLLNRELGAMMPLPLPFRTAAEKHRAAQLVRDLAAKMSCDCVVFICEGWGLSRVDVATAERLGRTGQVKDEPGAVDVLLVNVETYEGDWWAQPQVTTQGKERRLAPVVFRTMSIAAGNMVGYLPPKPGTAVH